MTATGSCEHLIVLCDALEDDRVRLKSYWISKTAENQALYTLINKKLTLSANEFLGFLLDPSADADVIRGCQMKSYELREVFSLTRTWCYAIHRKRMKLLGKWTIL